MLDFVSTVVDFKLYRNSMAHSNPVESPSNAIETPNLAVSVQNQAPKHPAEVMNLAVAVLKIAEQVNDLQLLADLIVV
jgi:hypothetical protein